ncbi:MAG TPA: hypothetical protein VFO77_03205 [Actinoplanes sp.]|nr:hypothetical protein [Actinoplanes sp.]
MNIAASLRTAPVTGLAIALAAGILLTGCEVGAVDGANRTPAAVGFVSPDAAATTTAPAATTTAPATAISGQRFYTAAKPDRLARLDGDKLVTVLRRSSIQSNWAVASPDGKHIAAVTDKGDLMITDAAGRNARKLITKVYADYGDHTWSPDSTKLLIRRNVPSGGLGTEGVVELATGTFTALPSNPLHPKWSGDGNTLVATDGQSGVMVLDAKGKLIRRVPGIGETNRAKNPLWIGVHSTLGVNHDGTRAAVWLISMSDPGGDIGSMEYANAVIDTVTGKVVPLPVKGKIEAALYRPDGSLLVRTRVKNVRTLTQIDPAGRVVARVTEPAAVKNAILVSWTN